MLTKTKIALAAVLVLGAATAAFAEDSSSSFPQNIYGPGAQQQVSTGRNVALTERNVALPNGQVINVQRTNDRASSPDAGGGY